MKENISLRIIVVQIILIFLSQGCYKIVGIAEQTSAEQNESVQELEYLSQQLTGEIFTHDSVFTARFIKIRAAHVVFEDIRNDKTDSVAFDQLVEIRFVKHKKGAFDGMIIGAGVGFAFGFGTGLYLFSGDYGPEADDLGMPLLIGGAGTVVGIPVGAVYGASRGAKVIYRPENPTVDQTN